MSDEAAAPAANVTPAPAPTNEGSTSAIAAALAARRKVPANNEPATPVTAGAAVEESPAPIGEDDAGTEETPSTDETPEADLAGEPPIARPKSWPKEQDEAWQTLPRHLQEITASVDRQRETEFLRGKTEAAEEARTAKAEKAAAEQARQQYEEALPQLYAQYQSQFAAEFSDLKSLDDVERMQAEDPMRFMRWQFAREKGLALERQATDAQQRQRAKDAQDWDDFKTNEDRAFFEKAPDLKDPVKIAKAQADASALLTDLGFTPKEIGEFRTGKKISPLDHRFQLLVRDGVRWRNAEKARKAATPKPVPPVQRPGTPTNGRDTTAHIQNLTSNLKRTGNVRDAAALIAAKRNAQARATQ